MKSKLLIIILIVLTALTGCTDGGIHKTDNGYDPETEEDVRQGEESKENDLPPYDNEEKILTNTSANIANGGKAAMDDRYIYYANSMDGDKLYRLDTKENTNEKVLDERIQGNIILYEDKIFFNRISGDNVDVCSVNKDGTGFKTVIDIRTFFAIDAGNIYYIKGTGIFDEFQFEKYNLCSMSIDGGNEQIIEEYIWDVPIFLYNDMLYYTAYKDYKEYNIKSGGSRVINRAEHSYSMHAYNDNLYYITDYNQLYTTDLTNNEVSEVVSVNEDYIRKLYAFDEYIFFTAYSLNKDNIFEIYRVKNDGSELTNIHRIEYTEPLGNIIKENIFIFKDKIILFDDRGINSEIRAMDFYGNDVEMNLGRLD
ncbi:DUF5050 domain-containing protein [Sedimentibacter sp.]|uniref:DUF5050 domain-containing protein n=1 Tax=Sedimentibacter sp. TaxID=1960295 RepID=UPI0028AF584C|nr:DUF5050 domain-containing protein [Sedimentibacter sp.]